MSDSRKTARQFRRVLINELRRSFSSFDLNRIQAEARVDDAVTKTATRSVFRLQCIQCVDDGVLTDKEQSQLRKLGDSLQLSKSDQQKILTAAAELAYEEEVEWAMQDGEVSEEEAEDLNDLRKNLGLAPLELYIFSRPQRKHSKDPLQDTDQKSAEEQQSVAAKRANEERHELLIGPTSKQKHEERVLTICVAAFGSLVVGLALVVTSGWNLYRGQQTKTWPVIDGQVTKTELLRTVHSSGSGNEYRSDNVETTSYDTLVHYRYSVDGREYSGSEEFDGISRWQKMNKHVDVHYSPGDPSQSVLTPGAAPANAAWLTLGILMILLAGIGAAYWRKLAARPDTLASHPESA
jgi:hypothetical protein